MSEELTELLADIESGEPEATERLAAAVYARLHAMADYRLEQMFGKKLAGITIQPTILVDDTLMRLIRQRGQFDSAGHFFAIASREMQRVLLDYCRQRRAQKRGGLAVRIDLAEADESLPKSRAVAYEVLNETLEQLEQLDARKAEVVKYRLLWGLSIEETADALGLGHATVERDWKFAKAWLAQSISESI